MGRHSRPVCAPGSPQRTRWGTGAPKRGYPHKNTILDTLPSRPESWWRQWNRSEVLRFDFSKYVVIISEASRCAHPPHLLSLLENPFVLVVGVIQPNLSKGDTAGTLPEDTLPLPYWLWNVQAGDVGMEPHCPPEAVVSQSGDQVLSERKIETTHDNCPAGPHSPRRGRPLWHHGPPRCPRGNVNRWYGPPLEKEPQ